MTSPGDRDQQVATFVYVSNAQDGDISTYRMAASGELVPGPTAKAASVVMPMAVSPDRRFLYAASRAKPYRVHVYLIDPGTGELAQVLVVAAGRLLSVYLLRQDRAIPAGRFL